MAPRTEGDLTPQLESALLRQVRRDYVHLSWTHFRESLRVPAFALIDSSATLARWRSEARTIDLSRQLVLEVAWGSVLEVLAHEMAHQYVDEILGVDDEPPHGPAFVRVCQQRGIDARAHGVPAARAELGDPRIERLRSKVRRLLALAASDNQHEAELAMLRARELLLKHNLEHEGSAPGYVVRWLGVGKKRISGAEYALGGILRDHFHVEPLWVDTYDPRRARTATVLEICGTAANVEMAEYVHAFLLETAERLWKERKGQLGGRARQAFQRGVMSGFRDKLAEQGQTLRGEGLVWVGDADLKQFFRRRHPRVRSVGAGRTSSQWGAHAHGREAGRSIVLHRPLSGRASGGGGGGLLPSGS